MVWLVRAATDRNPPSLGGGGCQRRMPGKPGIVCARSDQGSVNDGTVPVVCVLRQQTPVLSPVSLGTLSVEPEVVMSPGALTGDMPAVPVQCLQEAAAAQLRGARV